MKHWMMRIGMVAAAGGAMWLEGTHLGRDPGFGFFVAMMLCVGAPFVGPKTDEEDHGG